jgi:hypothetical protein
MTEPSVIDQRLIEEAFRRQMQRDEAVHRATLLALFYTKLIEGGVPEDEAFTLTSTWLENGMFG